jgi:predicted DNA-binding transcriptional regulator AlpA
VENGTVKTDANDDEVFVGINEASQVVGYSQAYIGDLCRSGVFPFHQSKPGAERRFLVSELRAWVKGEWKPAK